MRSSGLEQAWLPPDLFLGQKTPDAGRSAGLPGLESVLPRPALVKASKPAQNPVHSGLVKRLVRKGLWSPGGLFGSESLCFALVGEHYLRDKNKNKNVAVWRTT